MCRYTYVWAHVDRQIYYICTLALTLRPLHTLLVCLLAYMFLSLFSTCFFSSPIAHLLSSSLLISNPPLLPPSQFLHPPFLHSSSSIPFLLSPPPLLPCPSSSSTISTLAPLPPSLMLLPNRSFLIPSCSSSFLSIALYLSSTSFLLKSPL